MKSMFVVLFAVFSFVFCSQVQGEFLPVGKVNVGSQIGLSDKLIVWEGDEGGLWGFDRSTQKEFIIDIHGFIETFDLSGSNVAFISNSTLYIYDHETQRKSFVSSAIDDCAIDGKLVVFRDKYKICLYDIESQSRLELGEATGPRYSARVAISGNFVVWTDMEWVDQGCIYSYYIDSQVKKHVDSFYSPCLSLDMDGEVFAMRHGFSVLIMNLRTNDGVVHQGILPVNTNVSVSGNLVVFNSYENIISYDVNTYSSETIADGSFENASAVISGNMVVWKEDRGWGYEPIFGVYLDSGNDECSRATEVVKGVALNGSTVDATGLDITSGSLNDHKDVWHYFEPAVSGSYTVSLCGSGFDTTVGVFADCHGQEVAFNDDLCGIQSQVSFKAKAGVRYLIRVAGYDGDSGEYTVMVTGGAACVNRPVADISGDCKVDMADLAMVAAGWLSCGLDDESACWD
ncbi:MAG: hypothetical protein K9M75_07405 [Phycisphaerae bacterium]|nr:hypothetical protein [Phycisphaerae bacterium]